MKTPMQMRGRFSLCHRKLLKSSGIMYNGLEIKNDITKERRGLRHDVVYEIFCLVRDAALIVE